ncbi:MAG: nucleoside hydrolase-like domain-containing protein [Opitutus sp.]
MTPLQTRELSIPKTLEHGHVPCRRVHLLGLISALLVALTSFPALTKAAVPAATEMSSKPRLIVLTDISNEPDDEQSLVRLLVYSNEFDLEGLVATTSVWLRNAVRPEMIKQSVGAYGEVRANLLKHAPGFPSAEHLMSIVKSGAPLFGMAGVGDGKETEGSQWIISAVDREDSRPLWVSIWGGSNCLAQALWTVRHSRTAAELAAFIGKLRVYTISDQDDAGLWIRQNFPGIFYIVSPSTVNGDEYYLATWTGISGDRHYKNAPLEHFDLVDNPWLTEHVRENHGPLGALYPRVAYIMEGDTPAFLSLIANGLASDRNPGWGGWGGRYIHRQPFGESHAIWTNSRDSVRRQNGEITTSHQATIWRWREAYQHDFAARMDWCVKPVDQANHNPRLVVNGSPGKAVLEISAQPGDVISLSAAGSQDPDGQTLTYRWFHYPEAGNPKRIRPEISLSGADTGDARFTVPPLTEPAAFHVILEAVDAGTPRLFAYRRIIVNGAPSLP